jgi:WD40 repeat protein
MNRESGSSHSTILDAGRSWWLEPGLAALAFGSRPQKRSGAAATGVSAHLAFLPPEAIEIDLADPAQRNFGDYELLELIGQGGMGVVYRARQKSLAREVAVKLLSAGPWASPDFIERFEREAQSAARMQHPNVVPIHEIGAHEELNFFSMQLVKGGSLAQKLARNGPLPPREAAKLLRSVAEAVDYAHRFDVLHLDLKPGNVLLDENGEPLVADFGLAKRLDETLAADSTEVSGTPSYMAPEQAQVEKQCLSIATDIYGLGAILYECLVGRPPFTGATAQDTLRQVTSEAPRAPRELQPAVPADLEAICLRCLAKDPAQRYGNARALVDDLTRFLEGRETRARPLNVAQRAVRFGHREPKLAAALALVLFTLAMGFGASWLQWQRAERSAADARHLLWEGRREAALELESKGEGIEALPRLLANLEDQERSGDQAAAKLERLRIGLLEAGGARLLDAIVVADANPLAVALSPAGDTLAVSFSDQSVRWYDTKDFSESGRILLGKRPTSDGQPRAIQLLRFLDASHVLATGEWYENQVSPANGNSWLLDLKAKSVLEPPAGFVDFADATFSDNGRYATLRDRKGRAQLWQVNPWKPLSGFSGDDESALPWLVDPQGRFAATLTSSMSRLHMHRVGDFENSVPMPWTRWSGVSAWAITRGGERMALGDFDGRLIVMDTNTLAVRDLPAGRGRQVGWVAFSEDDAWVVAGTRDGNINAYEVDSGDNVSSGTLKVDFAVQRVAIDHARRLLLATGEGQSALWRLSPPGPRAAPAQRLGTAPARHGIAARYPIDWSPATGLVATSGLDGQLRLWRLPEPVLSQARAASQVPEQFSIASNAVVDVAWDQVRLLPLDGRPPGPWLRLPQPPGFAELVDGGRRIALTIGPRLELYEAQGLRAAATPQDLPNTPERFATDGAGRRIAMVFGGSGADGFEETLRLFDARTGKPLPGEVRMPGPLRRLQFSIDGTRLLAVGSAEGSTQVFAVEGLKPLGEYPHDPYQPVMWADFDAQGNSLRLATRATDPRLGGNSLVTWNIADDKESSLPLPASSPPLGVIALDHGRSFVAAFEGDFFADTQFGESLPNPDPGEATAVLARSPDGRLVAHASRRQVQLFDVASGKAVGMPLRGDGDAQDIIARLAFAPDGRTLVGRTLLGHWLRWPIAAEARATAAVRADVAAYAVAREDQRVLHMPSRTQRAAWRASDTGAWPRAESRPGFQQQLLTFLGWPIPRRTAAATPLMLDLAPTYDVAPEEVRSVFYNVRPALRPVPVGVQRIGGQWFDIRGMAQVGFSDVWERRPRVQIRCLAVDGRSIAAVHPLLLFSMPHAAPTGTVLADFTLHFSDGGSVRLPIVAGRDVRGYSGDDRRVPLAFAGDVGLSLLGMQDDIFAVPRIVNPEPARPVRCLDLETRYVASPMLLLAATLEVPKAGAPDATAAGTAVAGTTP